jgi:hypothetical protein
LKESPEVRQFAEDCRRRIAVALHSLGDEINPRSQHESQQPRFNRPEDADGFLQSSAEPGVDADEDSKRRQREELMYWNRVRLEKLEKDNAQSKEKNRSRGSSFDDFLHEDPAAEKGTFVYNSGADVHGDPQGLLHRRSQGVRGLDRGAVFANPFADENHIELEEQRATDATLMSPEHSEMSEDIYGIEEGYRPSRESSRTLGHQEELVDVSEQPHPSVAELVAEPVYMPAELETTSYQALESPRENAFASIHAWADNSSGHDANFYSPLPVTPASVASDDELVSGQATPTDSASLAGSGEDIGDGASSVNDDGRHFDVISEDGDGMHTPWTEVGSVVSESDAGHPQHP